MNITSEVNELRKLFPNALVIAHIGGKSQKYEVDRRHERITDVQHEADMQPLRDLFGSRLIERFSHCTGHFDVYVKRYEPEHNN